MTQSATIIGRVAVEKAREFEEMFEREELPIWGDYVARGLFLEASLTRVEGGSENPTGGMGGGPEAGRGVAVVTGFPAYGAGPFERYGLHSTVGLLLAFLAVCCLEAVAGGLVWFGLRTGAVLALALLAPGVIFWWGFKLPFPPIFAVARTLPIVLGWRWIR